MRRPMEEKTLIEAKSESPYLGSFVTYRLTNFANYEN